MIRHDEYIEIYILSWNGEDEGESYYFEKGNVKVWRIVTIWTLQQQQQQQKCLLQSSKNVAENLLQCLDVCCKL